MIILYIKIEHLPFLEEALGNFLVGVGAGTYSTGAPAIFFIGVGAGDGASASFWIGEVLVDILLFWPIFAVPSAGSTSFSDSSNRTSIFFKKNLC